MKLLSIAFVVLLVLYGLNEMQQTEYKQAIVNIACLAACIMAIVEFNNNYYGKK